MAGSQDEFIPTRRSLITRLKNWDDQEGWKRFFDTYWRLIYSVAIKSGLSDTDAQDIVQETVVAVARRIPDFQYNPELGSFKGWLLLITRRRIIDHLRKRARSLPRVEPPTPHSHRSPTTDRVARIADPAGLPIDRIWEEEWQEKIFATALTNIKRRIDAKQFQLFDCYALKGWPVEEVSRHLRATPGQIYTAKSRVAALLRAEMERLEKQIN